MKWHDPPCPYERGSGTKSSRDQLERVWPGRGPINKEARFGTVEKKNGTQ